MSDWIQIEISGLSEEEVGQNVLDFLKQKNSHTFMVWTEQKSVFIKCLVCDAYIKVINKVASLSDRLIMMMMIESDRYDNCFIYASRDSVWEGVYQHKNDFILLQDIKSWIEQGKIEHCLDVIKSRLEPQKRSGEKPKPF